MLNFNSLIEALQPLGLQKKAVIAHASLRSFGFIEGGADALVTALLYVTGGLMMPSHTYKPMVTPDSGPANNAVNYARAQQWNRLVEPFRPEMPVDVMMGLTAEGLRQRPESQRSMHPILSFTGVNVQAMLAAQTLEDPLAPLMALANADGWCLLLGVDQTANTSIHLAEKLAGRKQFTRWARLEDGSTLTCPGFPGCSAGFEALAPDMESAVTRLTVGSAQIQAFPLRALISRAYEKIKKDPLALLCQRPDCERCAVVRELLKN